MYARRHLSPRAGTILLGMLLLSSVAHAQSVRGRVVDGETGEPVPGTIVKALGAGGEVGGGTLSNDQGTFTLTLPAAGFQLARVTVERIGYTTQIFDAALFAGGQAAELRLESAPIQLGGIVATAERLCGREFGNSGSVQTIWDEARKSLEITALSQAGQVLGYETQSYERDLRPHDYAVLRGSGERKLIRSESPYRSISVAQMTEQGWAVGSPAGGMDLFAPDATVLLTEEFAAQHCFRGEVTPEAILLHFTPNDQRRSLPELDGTLVLDPQTGELTELRFTYVGVPELREAGHAGGEIYFFAAPNGMRVVREWVIRAPALTSVGGLRGTSSDRLRVEFVHETGGRILAVRTGGSTIRLPVEPLEFPGAGQGAAGEGPKYVPSLQSLARGTGAEVVLRNNDVLPLHVTQVRLRGCDNIVLPCTDFDVDVVVEPGESRVLLRVLRDDALRGFRFEWDYVGEPIEPGQVIGGQAPPSRLPAPNPNVVTAAEIPVDRFATALDLVRSMRPQWLRARANVTSLGAQVGINVYRDNVALIPILSDLTVEDALSSIAVEEIERIEWLDAREATTRWGTNHPLGAIAVTTSRAR